MQVFFDQKMTFICKTHFFLQSKLVELQMVFSKNTNFVSQKVKLGHGKKSKGHKIKKNLNEKFRDSQKLREIIAISTMYSYGGFG